MDSQSATASPAGIFARVKTLLVDPGEAAVTKRLAATIFIIRVVSAVMAYAAQILLARWMGTSDYGVYVYVWTWVLMLGCDRSVKRSRRSRSWLRAHASSTCVRVVVLSADTCLSRILCESIACR